jgi:serine/threonine-protein kinase RsbW
MAAEIPNVRLRLAGNPESVALVRQAVSALAEAIGLDPLELNEVNTAVSEAANNAVLHAYEGEEGPLEVDMSGSYGALGIAVRDRGRGMSAGDRATAMPSTGGIGIGLPVIQALAREVKFNEVAEGGTEVWMEFETSRPHTLRQPPQADGLDATLVASSPRPGTAALAIAPSALARAIVPRILSALAARADFTTDRISDTQLLADALVAQTDDSLSTSHLNVEVVVAPRELQLRVGPLHAGHADALIHDSTFEGLGAVLAQLADGYRIEHHAGSSEMLALRVRSR